MGEEEEEEEGALGLPALGPCPLLCPRITGARVSEKLDFSTVPAPAVGSLACILVVAKIKREGRGCN